MKRAQILIKTQDGVCEAWEITPTTKTNSPAVLMYMDAIGIRDAQLALADELAAQGFHVLVPNLFYRDHKLPLIDYPQNFTKEALGAFFPGIKSYMSHLTPQKLVEDAHFYLNHLKDLGPVKLIGFCFGGGHAVRTAAKYPDLVSHVVSLHAGNLASEDALAPVNYLSGVRASLYFGHADHDSSMPLPMIDKFEKELKRNQPNSISKIFKDAHHGFTMTDLPAHHAGAHKQAMKEAIEFFKT
jgi:carboxymethylenebutenolidase